jgi:hypothetical protein
MRHVLPIAAAVLSMPCQAQIVIDRSEYRDRLHGMWLGAAIANWTGLTCEGRRVTPPFFTDANWGDPIGGGRKIDFVFQSPWLADDDTDIEYVYLHLLDTLGRNEATAAEIAVSWSTHINRFIWVSNQQARWLIGQGVRPPATGFLSANPQSLMIDAQLTTEIFGAFTPGMPEEALRLARLPIGTTASGYAAHAAEFFAALFALGSTVDRSLSGREQALWLVREARRFVPDGSKAADCIDFVRADFLSNPDPGDWERTRDLVAARFQTNAAANGFVYRGWYESSVNLASGVICLLYGEMDYRRTVQIGTLCGWDADNPTATMGALIGLVGGVQGVRAAFPERTLDDRYDIWRTRDGLPDRLPADPAAQDTFALMADRALVVADRAVADAGGVVDFGADRYVIPGPIWGAGRVWSPSTREDERSTNLRMRRDGIAPAATSSEPWPTGATPTGGAAHVPFIVNGLEYDYSGREVPYGENRWYDSGDTADSIVPGRVVQLQVTYPEAVRASTVRFVEGPSVQSGPEMNWGGWFEEMVVELRIGSAWQPVSGAWSEPLDAARPWQILDLTLSPAVEASGVRVRGATGGGFVTCAELDLLDEPRFPCIGDLNVDRVVDDSDFVLFVGAYNELIDSFADFNRDGVTDDADFVLFAGAYNDLLCGP